MSECWELYPCQYPWFEFCFACRREVGMLEAHCCCGAFIWMKYYCMDRIYRIGHAETAFKASARKMAFPIAHSVDHGGTYLHTPYVHALQIMEALGGDRLWFDRFLVSSQAAETLGSSRKRATKLIVGFGN
eukprot:1155000-Pelagomonas_calceolata.AAC.3